MIIERVLYDHVLDIAYENTKYTRKQLSVMTLTELINLCPRYYQVDFRATLKIINEHKKKYQ